MKPNREKASDHSSYGVHSLLGALRTKAYYVELGPTTTQLRDPICPGERLAVTIRYLVTGDSMPTITFSYR
uniref:Uncharacterized protein n=1 Tax=Amphimedon queenslandica TaxID=400682 RepID=A0A1X7UJ73_AMPQE